ncbi:hypothetical protein F5Y19DRAFT_283249 [Xylariaceae sp. FL1651]|nr:hypothetical protein F5Y19DRAFT_283249 [Xylariaceae sp. FL1651]
MDSISKLLFSLPSPSEQRMMNQTVYAGSVFLALKEYILSKAGKPVEDPLEYSLVSTLQQLPIIQASYSFQQWLATIALGNFRDLVIPTFLQESQHVQYMQWVLKGRRVLEYPASLPEPMSFLGDDASCDYLPRRLVITPSCAYCFNPTADFRCGLCVVRENGSEVVGAAYCTISCHKAHWNTHKEVCMPLKRLHRAVLLARKMLHALYEQTYIYGAIKTVTVCDRVVTATLEHWLSSCLQGAFIFMPFDKSLFSDADHAAAAMRDLSTSRRFWHTGAVRTLLEKLIAPFVDTLQGVVTDPKNSAFGYAALMPWPGRPVSTYYAYRMMDKKDVLQVSLKSRLKLAVDLTGTQYGWREPLMLWDHYVQRRCDHIYHVEPDIFADIGETQDSGFKLPNSGKLAVAETLRGELMTKMMGTVEEWLLDRNLDLCALVSQAPQEYEDSQSSLFVATNNTLEHEINQLKDQGLYRLYTDSNKACRVTTTMEESELLKKVWLSDDEIKQLKVEDTVPKHKEMYELWMERAEKHGDLLRGIVFMGEENDLVEGT